MADYIVLFKQVPDITTVSGNAFDENGHLKRGQLPLVVNELDKSALALAQKMRRLGGDKNSRIIALTMGPQSAVEVLHYAMSRCADAGCLLTDTKFAGADTWATAELLSKAVLKLVEEKVCSDSYYIVAGMQSCDGDTAQVPPQLAAKLDIPIVPYAVDVESGKDGFVFNTIDYRGNRKVRVGGSRYVVTAAAFEDILYPSFSRSRWAAHEKIITYNANSIAFEDTGAKISKTRVVNIYAPSPTKRKKIKLNSAKELAAVINEIAAKHNGRDNLPCMNCSRAGQDGGRIWVVCCCFDGVVSQAPFELTGKASQIGAACGKRCQVLLIGNNCAGLAKRFIEQGAAEVYLAQDEVFAVFDPVVYGKYIAAMINKYCPDSVIFQADAAGRVIAPMAAMYTGNGLTADCTGLEICPADDEKYAGRLLQVRPALGGNIMAAIVSQNSKVEMATVRAGVFPLYKPDTTRKGEIISAEGISHCGSSLSQLSAEHGGDAVDFNADIIVSGGAGLKTKAVYEQCVGGIAELLAKNTALGVQRGASRRAVELGLAPRQYQIGQTGTTVRPLLYIAIGISGAVQHIVGISGSCVIISICDDPSAPIVEQSDYYLTGQAQQIAESLIEELEG